MALQTERSIFFQKSGHFGLRAKSLGFHRLSRKGGVKGEAERGQNPPQKSWGSGGRGAMRNRTGVLKKGNGVGERTEKWASGGSPYRGKY